MVIDPEDMADMTTYVFRLPYEAPPVTANEARSQSQHWGAQWEAKRNVEAAVTAIVTAAHMPPVPRLQVTLTWFRGDYGRCDPDGLGPMAKACIDALTPPKPAIPAGTPTQAGTPRKKPVRAKVGAGIVPDDSAEFVESVTLRIVLGDDDPRIMLTLTPLPALPPRPTGRTSVQPPRQGYLTARRGTTGRAPTTRGRSRRARRR